MIARKITRRAAIAVVLFAAGCSRSPGNSAPTGETTDLHRAAASGEVGAVREKLAAGANPNARDEDGRTPLHLAGSNGHGQTVSELLNAGADPDAVDTRGYRALDYAAENGHSGTAEQLRAVTAAVKPATANERPAATQSARGGLNPSLKYPDAESFGKAIGAPALHLAGKSVHIFAARKHESAAKVVLPYLDGAFDALAGIVGQRPDYDLVVYHFPKGHPEAFGGTSNGTIWYDDQNLLLDQQEEWREYRVPHVSGYIEEMAHNFVSSAHVQFGWEMVGWSVGIAVTSRVASNPIFESSVEATRLKQDETFRRYVNNDFVFPSDIESNLVDRIHAHLLFTTEMAYGPSFWRDFFAEIQKSQPQLIEAESLGGNAGRNARYQICVDCFDRLRGTHFKQLLLKNGISITTDIKSLDPTSPSWNRRLQ